LAAKMAALQFFFRERDAGDAEAFNEEAPLD
jgi:hypothetical protein